MTQPLTHQHTAPTPAQHRAQRLCRGGIPHGFTLIEILVVAVIVVLMLGMALPVFRAITGSRSEAGATNHVAAMLGRARADAQGLQKTIGVAFLLNNSTQVQCMAEVEFPDCSGWSPLATYVPGNCVTNASIYYYCIYPQAVTATFPGAGTYWVKVGGPPLEIRPDTDLIPLPTGVGLQTVCNCSIDSTKGTRTTDGYLNLGVILFDGQGRITCQNYGISQSSKLGKAAGLTQDYPVVLSTPITYNNSAGVPSQFGLVVYQRDQFIAQGFPTTDLYYTEPYTNQLTDYPGSANQNEENWLDQNATPLVIDRYTGTLIRGE